GARLSVMTQSKLYRGARARKPPVIRKRTKENIELVVNTVEALTGTKPTQEAVWQSLNRQEALSKKSSAFLWKAIHEAHKVGKYWEHTGVRDTHMPCELCDSPVESIEHILLECKASGQQEVWKQVRELWKETGKPLPHIALGLILGIGVVEIREDPTGSRLAIRLL
ncbi:hypothetical protein DFP72DRAFT_757453, partial [Ephemerocybe angulata]